MSIVLGIEAGTANLLNPYYGRQEKVQGIDSVVVVGAKVPASGLFDELQGKVPAVHLIGDAAAPRDVASALEDAVGLCSTIQL